LTEQNIPLLSSETLMIQNATEVRLIIHLKIPENNADLAKAHFLHYIAENIQDQLPFMILLQKEWNKIRSRF
jgi:hypothetical protein